MPYVSTLSVLPPFPPLWINEVQPENLTGITNGAGQRSGWLELFNPSASMVSLTGLFLSTNYGNLTDWTFPPGATIYPGEFKLIFADGQPGLSTTNEFHSSFTLANNSGSLALSRLYLGQPQALDYIDYTNLAPDHSFGSVPDGQSFDRHEFAFTTPGGSNNAAILPSYIPYTSVGQVYFQDFDSLPNPGATSVNTANPVTINGITYSLANPFDFAFPVVANGGNGGVGTVSMTGWYGRGALASKFGASDGDQTTGGQISFGLPADPDRALGLLATSSTGATAFGAKLINQTGRNLQFLAIYVTGELWRQSNLPKTLQFYYFIDPTDTTLFPTSATAFVPNLNVSFPTSASAVGGLAVDGSTAANQVNLGVMNLALTNWPVDAALWLVWEMPDSTGKAQGLGIDHFAFAASDQPMETILPSLSTDTAGTNLIISWLALPGQTYQIEYKNDLKANTWIPLGSPMSGNGARFTVTNDLAASTQRYYRLRLSP